MNEPADASEQPNTTPAFEHPPTKRSIAMLSRHAALRAAIGFVCISLANAVLLRATDNRLLSPLLGLAVFVGFFVVLSAMLRYARIEMMRTMLRRNVWQVREGTSSPLYLGPFHVAHAYVICDADEQMVRISRKIEPSLMTLPSDGKLWVVARHGRLIVSLPGGATTRWAHRLPTRGLQSQVAAIAKRGS